MKTMYRVTTRNWTCIIEAVQVKKETEHMVTFVPPGDSRKDFVWTQRKLSTDHRWFGELVDAKTYALEFIQRKIEYHQSNIEDFIKDQIKVNALVEEPTW